MPAPAEFAGLLGLLACFVAFTLTAVAQDEEDASQIPSRPYDHVLDEARWLTVKEREKIQQELSRRFVEQQIDVYLVVLRDAPPQGVKTYARTLGAAWSRAPVWCVVLHVPGDPGGVSAEAGGAEIPQPEIDEAVAAALKRARRENTEKERAIAACSECANDLRFVFASHQRLNDRTVETVERLIAKRTNKVKKMKWLALGAGLALILVVAVLYLAVRMLRARRSEFVFPETVWRERFLGPHSGGGGITVNFK